MSTEKREEKREKSKRTRNFATVVYPESAPQDWIERLDAHHVMALISPLHDKDVNPNGEKKKPHYHVVMLFEGPKDFEKQVKPIFDEIGGVGREMVSSARGYARYLCHLDNPEKAQYSPSDVRCIAGANFYEVTNLPTDDLKMIREICEFCRKNEIYSLSELIDVSIVMRPEWFSMIAMSRCYFVDKYIKSLSWEKETNHTRKVVVDGERVIKVDTGEVIF